MAVQRTGRRTTSRKAAPVSAISTRGLPTGLRIARHWRPHPVLVFIYKHQIDIPLALLVAVLAGATQWFSLLLSTACNSMLFVSHRVSVSPNLYEKGKLDIPFVCFYLVMWTLLRGATMKYLFLPLGKFLGCPPSRSARFGEQAWLATYYISSFSSGLALIYHSPIWESMAYFWIDHPHRMYTGVFKAYYLLQLSFWIQQLLVVKIEKPRKDSFEFIAHHIVTCLLLIGSYSFDFTRIGSAILVTMDVADIFLCIAKCLVYIKWTTTCDAVFLVFTCVWVYTRHWVYNRIVLNAWYNLEKVITLQWDPKTSYFAPFISFWVFIFLLGALQILLIFWLALILRIAIRSLLGAKVQDERSDSEESMGCSGGLSSSKCSSSESALK